MAEAKRGARRRSRSVKADRENPESLEAEIPEIEITDLGNFHESTNIQVYGPSGHGKTVLAGAAPNAVYMSTEKGVVSSKVVGHQARLMRTPTWEHCLAAMNKADAELGPEDWLINDSLTKMQVLYLRWILKTIHEQNPHRDLDIPAIQDHQKWQNGFMRFVDHMVEAPYNTIFVCTPMDAEDKDGEDMTVPAITGKGMTISNYVSAQMDVVLYYAVSGPASDKAGQTIRRALAQPFPGYVTKDRYGALGKWWDVEEGDYWAMAEMITAIDEAKAKADA